MASRGLGGWGSDGDSDDDDDDDPLNMSWSHVDREPAPAANAQRRRESTGSFLGSDCYSISGLTELEGGSLASWAVDDFDLRSQMTVQRMLKGIEQTLYADCDPPLATSCEDSVVPREELRRECQDWKEAFPHLRPAAVQLLSEQDTGIQLICAEASWATTVLTSSPPPLADGARRRAVNVSSSHSFRRVLSSLSVERDAASPAFLARHAVHSPLWHGQTPPPPLRLFGEACAPQSPIPGTATPPLPLALMGHAVPAQPWSPPSERVAHLREICVAPRLLGRRGSRVNSSSAVHTIEAAAEWGSDDWGALRAQLQGTAASVESKGSRNVPATHSYSHLLAREPRDACEEIFAIDGTVEEVFACDPGNSFEDEDTAANENDLASLTLEECAVDELFEALWSAVVPRLRPALGLLVRSASQEETSVGHLTMKSVHQHNQAMPSKSQPAHELTSADVQVLSLGDSDMSDDEGDTVHGSSNAPSVSGRSSVDVEEDAAQTLAHLSLHPLNAGRHPGWRMSTIDMAAEAFAADSLENAAAAAEVSDAEPAASGGAASAGAGRTATTLPRPPTRPGPQSSKLDPAMTIRPISLSDRRHAEQLATVPVQPYLLSVADEDGRRPPSPPTMASSPERGMSPTKAAPPSFLRGTGSSKGARARLRATRALSVPHVASGASQTTAALLASGVTASAAGEGSRTSVGPTHSASALARRRPVPHVQLPPISGFSGSRLGVQGAEGSAWRRGSGGGGRAAGRPTLSARIRPERQSAMAHRRVAFGDPTGTLATAAGPPAAAATQDTYSSSRPHTHHGMARQALLPAVRRKGSGRAAMPGLNRSTASGGGPFGPSQRRMSLDVANFGQ